MRIIVLVKKIDIVLCGLLFLTLPLFFYKLGQSSLVSWDEAWYAEIARNILKTDDFLNLTWSGEPYYDHPPAGFWATSIAFKLFGVSEFSARFMQALSGFGSVLVLYFLGREMFSKTVGFAAALSLPSAYWFLYRARTGNLDNFLTFFFLLTLFLALKAARDNRFLIPFSLSVSFLFLTKSMVPLVILPSLFIIFLGHERTRLRDMIIPFLIFVVLVGGWSGHQHQVNKDFWPRYFSIGLPGVQSQNVDLESNVKQAKLFLHEGVGKWFWPGVASLVLGPLFLQRRFFVLSAFFIAFAIPFVFSQRGGIWHLIPLHPVLILSFFGFSYVVLKRIVKREIIVTVCLLLVSLYVVNLQVKRSWYEFIDIPAYVSDEAILSREAVKYPQELLIEGSDFRPTAVFYSGKNVPQRVYAGDLPKLFAENRDFLMITYQRELDREGVPSDSYEILETDRDKILVLNK